MQMEKSWGQTNFDAYNEAAGGLTHDGKPIPTWDKLTDQVRANWEAGAKAVACRYWLDVIGQDPRVPDPEKLRPHTDSK